MANAYSILRTYGKFIPPFDLKLANAALESKQQTFDIKAAQLQDLIDTMVGIDMVNDTAKQYLGEKVEGLVAKINSVRGADLTNKGVYKSLESSIHEAVDDKIVNAYKSTINFRSLVSEIEAYKEDNPDEYNIRNEAFAMQDAYAYANSTDINATYKGGSYTPYVDVEEEVSEKLHKFVKDNGELEYDIPDGHGRTQRVKVKEMSIEQLRGVASSMLDSDSNQQLRIDAWYDYQGLPAADINSLGQAFVDARTKELLASQKLLTTTVKNNPNDLYSSKRLQTVQSELLRTAELVKRVAKGNAADTALMLKQESLAHSAASEASKFNFSSTMEVDEAYFDLLNYNLNVRKHNENVRHNGAAEAINRLKAEAAAAEEGGGIPTILGFSLAGNKKTKANMSVSSSSITNLFQTADPTTAIYKQFKSGLLNGGKYGTDYDTEIFNPAMEELLTYARSNEYAADILPEDVRTGLPRSFGDDDVLDALSQVTSEDVINRATAALVGSIRLNANAKAGGNKVPVASFNASASTQARATLNALLEQDAKSATFAYGKDIQGNLIATAVYQKQDGITTKFLPKTLQTTAVAPLMAMAFTGTANQPFAVKYKPATKNVAQKLNIPEGTQVNVIVRAYTKSKAVLELNTPNAKKYYKVDISDTQDLNNPLQLIIKSI